MLIRQGVEEASKLQGDWRKAECRLETTLRTQSQATSLLSPVLSLWGMQLLAHMLIAKVARKIGMFATRKTIGFVSFTLMEAFILWNNRKNPCRNATQLLKLS